MQHPEAEKLHSSLTDNGYDSLAIKIAQEMELSLDADATEREKWMHITLDEVEKHMNEETVKKIRKGCVCSRKEEIRIPASWCKNCYKLILPEV